MRQREVTIGSCYFGKDTDKKNTVQRVVLDRYTGDDDRQYVVYRKRYGDLAESTILLASFAKWAKGEDRDFGGLVPKDPYRRCLERCRHELGRGVSVDELLDLFIPVPERFGPKPEKGSVPAGNGGPAYSDAGRTGVPAFGGARSPAGRDG